MRMSRRHHVIDLAFAFYDVVLGVMAVSRVGDRCTIIRVCRDMSGLNKDLSDSVQQDTDSTHSVGHTVAKIRGDRSWR